MVLCFGLLRSGSLCLQLLFVLLVAILFDFAIWCLVVALVAGYSLMWLVFGGMMRCDVLFD